MATERTSVDGLFQAVNEMLSSVSLQGCTWETSPVTQESGWKAPKGKAFRITGKFKIDSDQSDIVYWSQPIDSYDLYIARDPDRYQELLAENNGDEEATIKS